MKLNFKIVILFIAFLAFSENIYAEGVNNIINNTSFGLWLIMFVCITPFIFLIFNLFILLQNRIAENIHWKKRSLSNHFSEYFKNLNISQIEQFLKIKNRENNNDKTDFFSNEKIKKISVILILFFCGNNLFAQNPEAAHKPLLNQPGIIITLVLLAIPILLGLIFALVQANNAVKKIINKSKVKEAEKFADHLKTLEDPELETELVNRKNVLTYSLANNELSGSEKAEDLKGVIIDVSDKLKEKKV